MANKCPKEGAGGKHSPVYYDEGKPCSWCRAIEKLDEALDRILVVEREETTRLFHILEEAHLDYGTSSSTYQNAKREVIKHILRHGDH